MTAGPAVLDPVPVAPCPRCVAGRGGRLRAVVAAAATGEAGAGGVRGEGWALSPAVHGGDVLRVLVEPPREAARAGRRSVRLSGAARRRARESGVRRGPDWAGSPSQARVLLASVRCRNTYRNTHVLRASGVSAPHLNIGKFGSRSTARVPKRGGCQWGGERLRRRGLSCGNGARRRGKGVGGRTECRREPGAELD